MLRRVLGGGSELPEAANLDCIALCKPVLRPAECGYIRARRVCAVCVGRGCAAEGGACA